MKLNRSLVPGEDEELTARYKNYLTLIPYLKDYRQSISLPDMRQLLLVMRSDEPYVLS